MTWGRARAMCLVVTILSTCVGLTGCGKSASPGSTISGKITYKGAPVANGSIKFFTKADKGFKEVYAGVLKQDGSFSFSGVPALGEVVITVATAGDPLAEMAQKFGNQKEFDEGMQKVKEWIAKKKGAAGQPVATSVPAKYNDPTTSGLNWQINEGINSKDFELQ